MRAFAGFLFALLSTASMALAALPGPASLTVTARGSVLLTWDAVPGASGYRVLRSQDGGAFAPLADLTLTAASDASAVACSPTVYTYKVVSLSGTAQEGESPPVSIVIPCQPQALTVRVEPPGLVLSWSPPGFGSPVSYAALASLSPVGEVAYDAGLEFFVGNALAATYTASLAGSSRFFAVVAVDADGNSSRALALPVAHPAAPQGLTGSATGESGTVHLEWQASTTQGVTLYALYRATTPTLSAAVEAAQVTATAWNLGGGLDGEIQYYWVAPLAGAAGAGNAAGPLTLTPYAPPSAPSVSVSAIAYAAALSISWTASVPGGYPIGSYHLELDQGSGFSLRRVLPATARWARLDVPCGVSAVVRVRSLDATGRYSAYSLTASASAPCPPAVAAALGSGNTLTLTYLTPAAQAQPVTSVFFAWSTQSAGADPLPNLVTPSSAPAGVTALAQADGESRFYRAYAVDAAGATSAGSSEIAWLPAPLSPTVLAGRERIYLRWQAPTGAPGLSSYVVYYDTATPTPATLTFTVVPAPAPGGFAELTLTALSDGTDWYVRIAASSDAVGGIEGSQGAVQVARTGHPHPLINLFQQSKGGAIFLSWTAEDLGGATLAHYRVYRASDAFLSGLTLLATTTATSLLLSATQTASLSNYYFVTVSDTAGFWSGLTPPAGRLLEVPHLPAPVVSAVVTSNARVRLDWDPIPGATEYEVYRSTAIEMPLASQGVITGLSFTDVSPYNGQENYYRVLARRRMAPNNSFVESELSVTVTARPQVPPGKPGRFLTAFGVEDFYLTATAALSPSGSTLSLSWTAAQAGSYTLAGYAVYRGADLAQAVQVAFVTGTAFTDFGLTAGFTYAYAVEAHDNTTPANAGPRLERTIPLVPPPPPSSLSVTALANPPRAQLSIGSPLSPAHPVTGYEIYRSFSPAQEGVLVTVTAASTYVDIQADPGYGTQYYRVFTRDNLGLRSQSFASAGVTLVAVAYAGGAPSQVVGLSARSLTGSAARLQWTPNPASQAVSAYHVYRGGSYLASTTADNYVDTTAVYGLMLSYTVQAENAAGLGASSTAVVLDHRPPPPDEVRWVLDAAGSTLVGVNLEWTDLQAPTGVSGYLVYRSTGAFTSVTAAVELASITSTSYRDASALPGVYYEYRVLSHNGFGVTGPASTVGVALTVTALPAAPLSFTAQALDAGGSVRLTWAGGGGAARTWIYRATSALGSVPPNWAKIAELAGSPGTYTDVSAQAGVDYHYGAAFLSMAGLGPAATATATAKPSAPQGLTASAGWSGAPQVSLSWSGFSGSGGATSYVVWRATDPLFMTAIQVGVTGAASFTDTVFSLTNTALYYRVQAVSVVTSAFSNPVTVTAYDPPSAPSSFEATPSGHGVSLRWNFAPASEGVTAFQIFYWHPGLPSGVTVTVPAWVTNLAVSPVAAAEWVTASAWALNAAGASPPTTVSARTNLGAGALTPLSFTVQAGFVEAITSTTRLELSWIPAGAPQGFYLYRSTAPIPITAAAGGPESPLYVSGFAGSVTRTTDFEVNSSSLYYYALTALSSTGESAPAFTPPVAPFNYPSFVSITVAQAGDARVDLAWNPPLYLGSAGALAALPYKIYRYDYTSQPGSVPGFKTQPADAGFPVELSSTSFADLNTINGHRYAYYISVSDALGREAGQASRAVDQIPRGPGRPPTNLRFIPGDRIVTIQWLAQKAEADLGLKYNVYRRQDPGEYAGPLPHLHKVGPVSTEFVGNPPQPIIQSLSDPTVQNLTRYCYTISVLNEWGESLKSAETCVTPFNALSPPSDPSVSISVVNRKDVWLTWKPAADKDTQGGYKVKFYRVYRSADGGSTYQALTDVVETTYTDTQTAFGNTYVYRVVPVDEQLNEGASYSLASLSIPKAENNVLVFRNSFNPDKGEDVPIQFVLTRPGRAWVRVYTLQGELVTTLFDEEVPSSASDASPYLSEKRSWDGRNSDGRIVASGVYLIHLEAPGFRTNARVAVIK